MVFCVVREDKKMDTITQLNQFKILKNNYLVLESKLDKLRQLKLREKLDCLKNDDKRRLREINKKEIALLSKMQVAYKVWQKAKDATRAEDMERRTKKKKEFFKEYYTKNYKDIKTKQKEYYRKRKEGK